MGRRKSKPDSLPQLQGDPQETGSVDLVPYISTGSDAASTNEADSFEQVPALAPSWSLKVSDEVVQKLQAASDRIRERVKKTIRAMVEVGRELLEVKKTLKHGQFGVWLKREFGWTERTARNLMAVADRFGSKLEIVSDLKIQPSAAYLLAAPSVPEVALDNAVKRAQQGEMITTNVVKDIVAQARLQLKKPPRPVTPDQLVKQLQRCFKRWADDPIEFAQQLHRFAEIVIPSKDRNG